MLIFNSGSRKIPEKWISAFSTFFLALKYKFSIWYDLPGYLSGSTILQNPLLEIKNSYFCIKEGIQNYWHSEGVCALIIVPTSFFFIIKWQLILSLEIYTYIYVYIYKVLHSNLFICNYLWQKNTNQIKTL